MKKDRPSVSVILATYNRANLLSRSIESVLEQSYRDFELIIVDDASTDNTKEVVESFNDSRINYITYAKNKGAANARNIGIENSLGTYIAFQDSDDEWIADKLKKQMAFFNKAPDTVGVVYTDMYRINNGKNIYWHSPTDISTKLINLKTLNYQVFGLGIQSTLIKKSCFDKVGLFNEHLPRYIDLELFIRLSREYSFIHLKEPLVEYHATPGISTNSNAAVIAQELLLNKYYFGKENNKEFLSKQYIDLGHALWYTGQLKLARSYFLKAVQKTPFNLHYLGVFAASFLGTTGYNKISIAYYKFKIFLKRF